MQPRIASTAFALALTSGLCAQMSGGYTIDPTGSGARNFKTFLDAGKAVFAQGISGSVIFLVTPGSYNESFFLLPVTGASSTSTITFKSLIPGTVKLTGVAGDTITFFAGLSWFINSWYVLDGLEFVSAPGSAIRSGEWTQDIEVRNCTFAAAHGGSGSPRGLLVANGANTSLRWDVHHCKFTMPSGSTQGLYGSQIGQWKFHHNDVDINSGNQSIYLINNNAALNRIYNNLFYGAQGSSSSAGVINVDLSNLNNDICNNTFYVASNGGSLVRTFGTSGNFNRIYANVMAMTGPGTCVNVTQTGTLQFWESDANVYWAPSGDVGRIGTTPYNTLAAWQAATTKDAGSISGDPLFVGATSTPPNLHVLPVSPVLNASTKTPAFVTDDYDGRLRDPNPDIGAYELNGFAPYGTGCAGSGSAVPQIGATGTVAVGSTNFAVTLTQALGGTAAALMLGADKTTFSGIPLPYALGGGCNLYLAPLVFLGVGTTGNGAGNGTATIPLVIPNSPGLYGSSTYVGWVVIDSGATNKYGITNSAAAAIQL